VDAISLLTQDHRTVDELFDRFEKTSDPGERGELVAKMVEELSIHAAIEEQELYPVMHRVFSDDDPVDEAEHEHAEAKAILAVLSQLDPHDEHFEPMVEELIGDVRHHVEEEENELFPKLQEAVSDEELEELGQRLKQAKQGAPTKPSAEELQELSRDELYEFAQKIGLEGRSDMSKDELAKALAPS
jgi:hemerythrin superfamily protein